MFSQGFVNQFDEMTKTYGALLSRQSDRNLSRTKFSQGITTDAKLRGHEESGALLVILLMLSLTRTSFHIVHKQKLNEERAAAYIHLIESMLMMEQGTKQTTIQSQSLSRIKRHLRRVMQLFSSVIEEGSGNCTVKFHLPMHLIDDIKRFGVPANWDEGIGEHNHIANAKGPAELTQHQPGNFEYQTAVQNTENLAHGRAVEEYKLRYQHGEHLLQPGGLVPSDE